MWLLSQRGPCKGQGSGGWARWEEVLARSLTRPAATLGLGTWHPIPISFHPFNVLATLNLSSS